MQRPRYRSIMTRRVFMALLASIATLAVGVGVVAYIASTRLQGEPALLSLRAAVPSLVAQLVSLWPVALGTLFVVLLAVFLFAYWAARPADKLAATAAALTQETHGFATRATNEASAVTRNVGELSELLLRSSRELEKQNKLMTESVGRLEQLLRVGHEFSTILDAEQLLRRAANALHDLMRYERAGAGLIEGETLSFFLDDAGAARAGSPLRLALDMRSLAGRAAIKLNAMRVDDLRAQPGLAPVPGLLPVRSEQVVPVIHNQQVLAVLAVQSVSPAAFGPHDEEQLTLLAQMLASALANSSRLRDEQLRRQMAEAIYRVSQTLSGTLVSERVPELMLDQLAQVLPHERSALLLVEEANAEVLATRGYAQHAVVSRERRSLRDLPLIAEIVAQKHAIVLGNASADARYRTTVGTVPAQSWLGVPLMRVGEVTGVLVLESDKTDRYGREESAAMMAIANQAAVALENARLFNQAYDRNQRLEVITELNKLVSNHDVLRELPTILGAAIHYIRRIVPCDYAALALYNEDDETFSIQQVYDSSRDWSELPATTRVPAANTAWLTACRTAGPVMQSHAEQSDNGTRARNYGSDIVVPILGTQRLIGALNFASHNADGYRQAAINTLMELARYLGPALYNARLNAEREAAANQLAQTQEYLNLVDKVRVVGQLASGVAHDFNNLLAGILGNAQLLLYEIKDTDHRDMLRVIERAAKDGSETVRRLQGFARMEHDSPMTEVRLDVLARDAIDITRPRWRDVAQSRGLAIEINRQLQPVTPIAGRPAELREVLTNLIINAVDAMPQGGHITIRSYDDTSGSVMLTVGDTGVGMSPDVRERIFDPFFTTKGEQGTGLGLAVSLGIIESHGGQIDVESVIGEGTTFIIRLPVRAPDQVAANIPVGEVPIAPGHLLLVESELMIRESLMRLLTRWGHRVTQASGGVEALRTFQPELFDAVISDQGMPDMSGWDLLAQIKQREPRVPTVLMTGWGRQIEDDEARTRGADFVIEKPFDQDELRRVLAQAMNKSA